MHSKYIDVGVEINIQKSPLEKGNCRKNVQEKYMEKSMAHKLANWFVLNGFVVERFVGFALCVTLVCKTVALSINLMFKCVPLPDLHLQPRAPFQPLTVLNLKRSNKPKPQMIDHCLVKVIYSE